MSSGRNDGAILRAASIGLAMAAAAVAFYLGVVSLQMRGTPWGCGAGSGCADVLKSRWSNVGGIPVGFFAVAAYLAIGGLAFASGRRRSKALRVSLAIIASAVLSTAMYFIVMQVAVIKAICPWCFVDHGLGMSSAVLALTLVRRQTPRTSAPNARETTSSDPLAEYDANGSRIAQPQAPRRHSAAPSVIAGVMLSLAFVVLQHFTARAPAVTRIDSQIEQSSAGDEGLKLSLKNGDATLPTAVLPAIGDRDAPRKLILMFDYCCPHCREAHAVIRRLQAGAGGGWQVIFVPTPLNSTCNPAVEETEKRFRDACELARISLAVWKLKPADWGAFDDWLFEPELPRTAQEAHDHASALYGEIEIAEALIDPALDHAIKSDVRAYQATGARVLPVILSPGSAGIAGRTETTEELKELLGREFGYPAGRGTEELNRR